MKILYGSGHTEHLLKINISQEKAKSMKKWNWVPATNVSSCNFKDIKSSSQVNSKYRNIDREVFLCFQGVDKGCIGKEWVKMNWNKVVKQRLRLIFSFLVNLLYNKSWPTVYRVSKTKVPQLNYWKHITSVNMATKWLR